MDARSTLVRNCGWTSAWACDEILGYTITAHECSTGAVSFLHVLTVASICLCMFGFFCARGARPDAS